MNYVRCINNDGYAVSLRKDEVYLALPDRAAEEQNLLRILDETAGEAGSEDGYLFAKDRFTVVEPIELTADATANLTVHLPPALRGILHAESLAANKSMSALVREWIEERLDLPTVEQAA
ncbi:MAG: hypothetical protein DYG89_22170 [Caldilinea sp. CFX5]|nr:hypothetical protein [Caldilinea sp. CFX5]